MEHLPMRLLALAMGATPLFLFEKKKKGLGD
jgi:hypothetical protein